MASAATEPPEASGSLADLESMVFEELRRRLEQPLLRRDLTLPQLAQLATACIRDRNTRPVGERGEEKPLLERIQSASIPAERKRALIQKEIRRLRGVVKEFEIALDGLV